MSETRHTGSALCPVCSRYITVRPSGQLHRHGKGKACPGAILLNAGQLHLLRECWRIGDWRPVEREFGVSFPRYNPRGATPEEELADLVNGVREWITTIAELSQTRVPNGACHE